MEKTVPQLLQLLHRFFGIRAFATNTQLRSLPSGQHHQPHDTFAVYLLAFFRYPNFRAVPAGNAHKHGGRPGMQPEPIHDRNFFLDLLDRCRAVRSSIQQCHYVGPFCSISPSSFALKSTAAFWPRPFNFSSIAATSIKRAMSRPGLTGIVTCGTLRPRIS